MSAFFLSIPHSDSCHYEYEPLVAALRERGMRFLAPSDAQPGPEPIDDLSLIACLARCLHTLAARQPFDQLPAYDGLMSLLFAQLKAEAIHEPAAAG